MRAVVAVVSGAFLVSCSIGQAPAVAERATTPVYQPAAPAGT